MRTGPVYIGEVKIKRTSSIMFGGLQTPPKTPKNNENVDIVSIS